MKDNNMNIDTLAAATGLSPQLVLDSDGRSLALWSEQTIRNPRHIAERVDVAVWSEHDADGRTRVFPMVDGIASGFHVEALARELTKALALVDRLSAAVGGDA